MTARPWRVVGRRLPPFFPIGETPPGKTEVRFNPSWGERALRVGLRGRVFQRHGWTPATRLESGFPEGGSTPYFRPKSVQQSGTTSVSSLKEVRPQLRHGCGRDLRGPVAYIDVDGMFMPTDGEKVVSLTTTGEVCHARRLGICRTGPAYPASYPLLRRLRLAGPAKPGCVRGAPIPIMRAIAKLDISRPKISAFGILTGRVL